MDNKQLKKIVEFLGAREEYPIVKKAKLANGYLTFDKMEIDEKKAMSLIDGVEEEQQDLPNTKLRFGYFNRIIRQRVSYAFGRKCTFNRDAEVCDVLFDMDVVRKCAWFTTLHGFAWMEIRFDDTGKMLGISAWDPAHCFEFTDNKTGTRAFIIVEDVKDEFGMPADDVLGVRIIEDLESGGGTQKAFKINQYMFSENELKKTDWMTDVIINKAETFTDDKGANLSEITKRKSADIVMRVDSDPFHVGLFDELKTHVDEYDRITSETFDFVKKSPRNPLIIHGYGTSLPDLVRNAYLYNIIPVESDGQVEVLQSTQDVDAVSKLLALIEESMYEQSGAVKSEQGTVSYSGSALRMKYAQLDIAAQYLQSIMEEFFKRARPYMQEIIGDEELNIVFDMDVLVNESDTILNCLNSQEIISRKTILENHPWVHNLDEELRRLEEEGYDPELDNEGDSAEHTFEDDSSSDQEKNKAWGDYDSEDKRTSEAKSKGALNPKEVRNIPNNQKREMHEHRGE